MSTALLKSKLIAAINNPKPHKLQPAKQQEIPKFYRKKITSERDLTKNYSKLVFKTKLNRIRDQLLQSYEMDSIRDLIIEHSEKISGNFWLTFDNFLKIGSLVTSKAKVYFKSSLFLRFKPNQNRLISSDALFDYLDRSNTNIDMLFNLSNYGREFPGFITDEELGLFFEDMMPRLHLGSQVDGFKPYYLCICTRKLSFFLDPKRLGRVNIETLALSNVFNELLELRDPDLPKDIRDLNWFSAKSTKRVYSKHYDFISVDNFMQMNVSKSGMLDKKELSRYLGGRLTKSFIERLFAEKQTYNGQLDFVGYLDFVLAMEHSDTKEGLTWMFPIFDVKKDGFLDESTIAYFIKDVSIRMFAAGIEDTPRQNIINEIFDMANPQVHDIITLKDLQNCKQGDTIFNILYDFMGFHEYDTRPQPDVDPNSQED
ncbi:hypothetical protein BC833DRAFT_587720 [Globomyces pollinis-pini]|nr:hypothetical protein BC833DRAFT_587720 [Globomyces pollinis-pini]